MLTSLYLHIPFCLAKCHYCAFSSFTGRERLHPRYLQALCREVEVLATVIEKRIELASLFFGGGTPTVLSAEQLTVLLDVCRRHFALSADCEITIEANPGTLDLRKLQMIRKAGCNRLSIGVQSFRPTELEILGRCHTPEEALEAVRLARQAGFDNLSLDLMYGLPWQTPEVWHGNLRRALDLTPEHLSLYQLTPEEETPFAGSLMKGRFRLPAEEAILEMDAINTRECEAAGLPRYEISNYAAPHRRCRHNLNYWHNAPYLAAGAAAVSYLKGCRARRIADPLLYCQKVEAGLDPVMERENLTREESFRETVITGLRVVEGVSLAMLTERFGIDPVDYYGAILEKLISISLLEVTPTHLRLTEQGLLLANSVMAELV